MTQFHYEGYDVIVGEMNRISYLNAVKEVQQVIDDDNGNPDRVMFGADVEWFLIKHSRVVFKQDGKVLEAGTYPLHDEETLTLPLTRAGFDNLPLSLSQQLSAAAMEENRAAVAFFTLVWKTVSSWLPSSVIRSESGPTNAPKTKDISPMTTTIGKSSTQTPL